MSNVVKLPEQEKRYDEASDWIVIFDRGITADEKCEFQRWLHRDSKNHDVFMSMAQLWDGMDELSRLSDLFPDESTAYYKSVGSKLATAASLLLAVCVISLYVGKSSFTPVVTKTYETSIGEHSTVNLPDGSKVVLNTNSLVTVNYNDSHRLVTLMRGEIHIDVAHDKSRPLSVKAGDKVIQAVGTAFNIELHRNNSFELIVTDGEVRVGDRSVFENQIANRNSKRIVDGEPLRKIVRLPLESMSIAKGEKVVVGAEEEVPTKIKDGDIQASLSWRQGNLVFTGQYLEEAIQEISRYTSVEFHFADEEIKRVRIAGLFKAGDVNGLLSALSETFNISSKKTAKEKINLYRES